MASVFALVQKWGIVNVLNVKFCASAFVQAYGWSLPAKQPQPATSSSSTASTPTQVQSRASSSGVPVPVPVYCRPLMEKEPGMKIWCAAGVNVTGGKTKDGGNVVGASVFYGAEGDDDEEASSHKDDVSTFNIRTCTSYTVQWSFYLTNDCP